MYEKLTNRLTLALELSVYSLEETPLLWMILLGCSTVKSSTLHITLKIFQIHPVHIGAEKSVSKMKYLKSIGSFLINTR